jgi:DNA replication protein DnaC
MKMINEQVRQLSHQLRVFGVHAHFEARANEAQGKGLSHLEFLKLVLEDEALQRQERVAKSLMTRAKFRSSSDL